MNITALATNKQVLLALGMIVFVGAVVANGTGAFFSDTASATGNTFAAGTLELRIAQDSNGNPVNGWEETQNASWSFTNMTPGGDEVTDAVWLRNTGSVDGLRLGVAMANPAATEPGLGKQMRITEMTLGGNSLLEGGAGADIEEYEAPAVCDIQVNYGTNDYTRIGAAIDGAASGDVICVGPGNYSNAWEPENPIVVDQEVTIVSVEGPDTTQSIPFDVSADNVTIKGFEITNPNGSFGVRGVDVNGLTIDHNNIHDIGSSLTEGSAQAVYLHGNAGAMNGFIVTNNTITNVGNTSLVKGSGSGSGAKGVYIGDTAGSGAITGVEVKNNIISDIKASTNGWVPDNALKGRGAIGIMTNHGGNVQGAEIMNNTISDLEGLWARGIGLEGDTENAVVTLNDFSNVVDHKGSTDASGIQFEDNAFSSTVVVEKNNFAPNVPLGVRNATANPVTAQNNWWGDFDPSDQVLESTGSVDTSNFAGGPFAGLVNGNDANGNGYADFQDLNNDPIIDAGAGLDGGEQKQFTMSVQLDGPTTGNEYQGASFTTDFVFTLNQV